MGNTDYFGVKAEILNTKKLFLLDMDGTIYKEEELFSGTIETLTEIDKLGGTYIFITNNSSKSVSDYIEKMKKISHKKSSTSRLKKVFYLFLFISFYLILCLENIIL